MGATLDEIEIKISQDSKGASKAIDSLISSLEKLGKATDMSQTADKMKNLSKSVISLSNATKTLEGLSKFATWGFSLGYLGKKIEETVLSATKYTQILNNSRTVMGEASKDAEELADKLSNTLMLNPSQVMEFQTTFQNLFTGFGNTAKNAQIMSQNLTQLSYDMASFYEQLDRNPEAGMEKLRLAMAGTIEPLQRLGYALKEADLQAVAARQGLKVNVRNLNSASKSMLRYIAVMEQSERVQGNLARTFDSPATAMLVFKQAMSNLSNEIGKTFIPMLIAVVPYIQAFVKGALSMVQTINSMLGIKLPTIEKNFKKPKDGMKELKDQSNETGKAIKKAFTMGIDELNVFDSSTSSAAEGMQDITGLLKLPKYDMTEGFNAEKLQEIAEKMKPLEGFFDGMAQAIAGFIQGIKDFSDTTLYPWLVNLGDWMEEHPDTMTSIGEGLAKVGIGLLIIKGIGSIAKFLMIPELITGLKEVLTFVNKNKTAVLILLGASMMVYGALNLIKNITDLINGEGEFGENIRKGLANIYLIITGYLVAKAIPMALTKFDEFHKSAGFIFKNLGQVGSLAMLGIAVAAGVALYSILSNWDEASYNIQQAFGKAMKWIVEKIAFMGSKATEIFNKIKEVGVDVAAALIKAVARTIDTIFGWQIKPVLEAIDLVFKTNWSTKLSVEGISKMADEAAKEVKEDITKDTNDSKKWWDDWKDEMTTTWDGYLENSQKLYEEALADQKKAEDEKRKEELEQQKKDIEETMKGFEDIKFPDISVDSEDTLKKVTEMVDKQTEANDTQIASKQIQEQFNTDSLANDVKAQEALDIANKLMATDTTEVKQQLSGDTSAIITAIQRVEDACRDIRINVHYHISGGGDGYATGGTPRRGEYFYAREDGLPEMVGRVGRQTTVMNNGQIADTMAESMVKAMSQSGATSEPTVIENKLYLDGEVVYTNQEKIKRSKGYSFGLGGFANV